MTTFGPTSAADEPTVLEQVLAQLSVRHGALSGNLVRFASLLKAAELEVTTTQLLSAARSLAAIDLARREDVRQALAASFLTRVEDRAVFDLLFDRFWRLPRADDPDTPPPEPATLAGGEARLGAAELVHVAYAREDSLAPSAAGDTPPRTYSPEEVLVQKE